MASDCNLARLFLSLFWGEVLVGFWGRFNLYKKQTGVFKLPLLITPRNKLHVFNHCIAKFATFQ